MDNKRIKEIRDTIQSLSFVENLNEIKQVEYGKVVYIEGNVSINFDELNEVLAFDFKISPVYPFKSYEIESITFCNKELIPFNHVMECGNICIHTSHNTNLLDKLIIDFNSLKNWIIHYYINKQVDLKYEHIIVNYSSIKGSYFSFFFNETDIKMSIGDFGFVNLSSMKTGVYNNKINQNSFVKNFISNNGLEKKCNWSNHYEKFEVTNKGIYYFLEDAPARLGKFIFEDWIELRLPTTFLDYLYHFEKNNITKNKDKVVPLFLGYRINENESHWQAALLKIGDFPLKGIPIKRNGKKTGKWKSELISEKIKWALTRNVSYKYFFGRGIFSERITQKKILIIGIGAVGSMIAKTLTRGGCKYIDFIDYDVKEPENVCRSEYSYFNGISTKTEELTEILCKTSPYVNINHIRDDAFEGAVKAFYKSKNIQENLRKEVRNYDLIIDCSTDNDLMYVLESIKLEVSLLNISITNHAKEMVCAFNNIYEFVNNQFSIVLQNDIEDLYDPTGCWNPTFKASYNDINILVQYALNHINRLYDKNNARNNFVISNNGGVLKLDEF